MKNGFAPMANRPHTKRPKYIKPEVVATGPNQIRLWDKFILNSPLKGKQNLPGFDIGHFRPPPFASRRTSNRPQGELTLPMS